LKRKTHQIIEGLSRSTRHKSSPRLMQYNAWLGRQCSTPLR